MPSQEKHINSISMKFIHVGDRLSSLDTVVSPSDLSLKEKARTIFMLRTLGGLRSTEKSYKKLGLLISMKKFEFDDRPPIIVVSPTEQQLLASKTSVTKGFDGDLVEKCQDLPDDVQSLRYDRNGNVITVHRVGDEGYNPAVASLLPNPDGSASLVLGRRLTIESHPEEVDPPSRLTIMFLDCRPVAQGFAAVAVINVC